MSPSKPAASARSAFLGLGSNLGDRLGHLARAVARLRDAPQTSVVALSSVYATDPVGLAEQPEFLNAAAEIRTGLEAEELLEACQRIERELGRVREVRWGPRPIDLDLLLFAGRSSDRGAVLLPHPRMKERAFVLVPLAEIAPHAILDGRTIADWAAEVGSAGVRRVGPFPA